VQLDIAAALFGVKQHDGVEEVRTAGAAAAAGVEHAQAAAVHRAQGSGGEALSRPDQ
jgi:hypothetical protein